MTILAPNLHFFLLPSKAVGGLTGGRRDYSFRSHLAPPRVPHWDDRFHVDTGASNCLFDREHREMLGIEIEAGEPKTFWTANVRVKTFGHVVEIEFCRF